MKKAKKLEKTAVPVKTFKLARKHILAAIEAAMETGGPVERNYPHYKLYAVCYRQPGISGHTGVRVTWGKS